MSSRGIRHIPRQGLILILCRLQVGNYFTDSLFSCYDDYQIYSEANYNSVIVYTEVKLAGVLSVYNLSVDTI